MVCVFECGGQYVTALVIEDNRIVVIIRPCHVFGVYAQMFLCFDLIEFPRGRTGPVLNEVNFLRLDFLNVERSRYQAITLSLALRLQLRLHLGSSNLGISMRVVVSNVRKRFDLIFLLLSLRCLTEVELVPHSEVL